MKALLQRVARAEVRVDGAVVGRCGPGLLVLLGILRGDDAAVADRLAERVAHFRCFPDERERMNRAGAEVGAEALVISQVTLAHEARKGRRPSLDRAADPATAEALYLRFAEVLRAAGLPTETGRFGARMTVELLNDGPVTFLLEEVPAPAPVRGAGEPRSDAPPGTP